MNAGLTGWFDHHRLVVREVCTIQEGADVSEGNQALWDLEQSLRKHWTAGGKRIILRFVEGQQLAFVTCRKKRQTTHATEKFPVCRSPHGNW